MDTWWTSSVMFLTLNDGPYLFFWRNLCSGPSSASSITSMRFSASQIPIILTMYGLSSCCITAASRSISSCTDWLLSSFFRILTATCFSVLTPGGGGSLIVIYNKI
ncbi:hypothetical protein EYF80_059436 [Liparis tanakae]|uniref:Uncharacterized protein n=1 Tax=Liparis tanakae TaxID=230148 RepID=A0A4Z2ENP4_9TELE|nr:hypothetical protein EYF80_059436 [Liparis tanakae]